MNRRNFFKLLITNVFAKIKWIFKNLKFFPLNKMPCINMHSYDFKIHYLTEN